MIKAPLKKQIQKKVSSFVGTVVEATAPNKGLNKILPFGFFIFFKFGKRQNFVKPQPLAVIALFVQVIQFRFVVDGIH